MIQTNPEVKKIFEKYPAYSPVTKPRLIFLHRKPVKHLLPNNCWQRAGAIVPSIPTAYRRIMVMD